MADTRQISPAGGRIFFSGGSRSLIEEDEIEITSVGVDIGSSTAHLLFSRLTLERLDTRYVVTSREVLHASEILLTPYRDNGDIDAERLGAFVDQQYARSGIAREQVDAGALILTGVAVRRRNARAIGELFAADAGKFVALSAGDSLEAVMAAHGSGAVAASGEGRTILNIDIGGGTAKLAVCRNGEVCEVTAIEAGARLVVTDARDRIVRLEEFGARAIGPNAKLGDTLSRDGRSVLAAMLAQRILQGALGGLEPVYHRLPPIAAGWQFDGVVLSGGVSEFFYGDTAEDFGDLGLDLARVLRMDLETAGLAVLPNRDGIRATVVGASQYTVQVSGSTVFLDPLTTLPLRNLATVRPALKLSEEIDPAAVEKTVLAELQRFDLAGGAQPVALALAWQGSASFDRLHALSRGLVAGLAPVLSAGHPLVIVTDGDIGGLLGMHCREHGLTTNPIVSIDGISASAFDFIDIGEVLRATGAVPVVIKSLVFPGEPARLETETHGRHQV